MEIKVLYQKRNIFGTDCNIHGAVILTNAKTGKQKYFVVASYDKESKSNIKRYGEIKGGEYICLSSEVNVSQKVAALMPNLNKEMNNCEYLPKGWRF